MPFYALIHNAAHGYARIHPIRADELRQTDDGVVFFWDGRIVHQSPLRLVSEVRTFETAGDLYRFMDEMRQKRHGAAVFRIQEVGTVRADPKRAPSAKTGHLAESVTLSTEGVAKYPGSRKR